MDKGKIKMPADKHILLVDDYEVNQIVAKRHLESVGYKVDVAVDGSKAIEAFERGNYDLILMDIEMPVMDGWESTRTIRNLESATASCKDKRVPIIAMSGHVMEDDTAGYQQAGMDDSMAKPIERAILLELVQKWLQEPSAEESEVTHSNRPLSAESLNEEDARPIDLDKAIEEFMGDGDAVRQLLHDFVRTGSEQITTIEQAMSSADYEKIRLEAHALRGGAANLTAFPLAESCAGMEEAAGRPAPDQLTPLLASLKKEFNRLTAYVDQTENASGSAE